MHNTEITGKIKAKAKRASSPCLHIKERAGTVRDLMEYTTAFIESPRKGFVTLGWLPFMLPAPFLALALASFGFALVSSSGTHLLAAALFLIAAVALGLSRADAASPKETACAAWYLLGMDDAGLIEMRRRYLPEEANAA